MRILLKGFLNVFFSFSEEQVFESLVAYQFGLFGNTGAGNGSLYPEQYAVGNKIFQTRGCPSGENVRKSSTRKL
jgi:hypothetical protein